MKTNNYQRIVLAGICVLFLFLLPVYLYSGFPVFLNPVEFDFSTVDVGQVSENTSFLLENNSGGQLTGINVSLTGADTADFNIVANNCSATLDDGFSCDIVVQFAPGSEGSKTATLSVDTDTYDKTSLLLGTANAVAAPADDNDEDGCGLSANAAGISAAGNRHRIPFAGLLLSMIIPMALVMAGRSIAKRRRKQS